MPRNWIADKSWSIFAGPRERRSLMNGCTAVLLAFNVPK